ncbi:unnamed protein product [Callosobruchus maculatus]|uniref:Uncharacterized protein n=1 Tax=Callosobruchus maculatus TaxID=64391 RepID=A0A653C9A2_CALMS|nr:unnamed protein product [Callosobruchus maculatus]
MLILLRHLFHVLYHSCNIFTSYLHYIFYHIYTIFLYILNSPLCNI